MSKTDKRILVARESFVVQHDGEAHMFRRGVTRIDSSHPIVKGRESLFEAVDDHVHYGVEAASASPGEKRGEPRTESSFAAPKQPTSRKSTTAGKRR